MKKSVKKTQSLSSSQSTSSSLFESLTWFLESRWWIVISLCVVTLFAFLIRYYRITTSPKGALIDEAHFGYIAYSLLKTGKDEHGIAWPLIFKGFGDQKLPAYGYSLLPFIAWLGLSNLTIRIPSLIAGTLLVPAMYFLMRALKIKPTWCVFGAFLVAVNPWPFFLSRFGFESNLALFFFTCGLYAMVKSVTSQSLKWPVGAGLLLILTWYSYIAYRPVTVLISIIFYGVLVWRKEIASKTIVAFFLTFGLLAVPLFMPGAAGSNTTRFKQVGIFSDLGIAQDINENRTFCTFRMSKPICYAVFNKFTYVSKILMTRWIKTYSPQYLAIDGEQGLFFLTVTNYGQFYFVLYPFFIAGIVFLLLKQKNLPLPFSTSLLLILGLVLAPLPSVLAGEAQKVRLSALLPFVFIVITLGVEGVVSFIKDQKIRQLGTTILVLYVLWNAGSYLVDYYTVHTIKYDYTYQSYLPELFDVLHGYDSKTKIYIKPFFSDPVMFYAYYNHYDPARYQKLAVLGPLEGSGFQHTVQLDNIYVKDDSLQNIACEAVAKGKHAIMVTDVSQGPRPVIPVKEIRSENNALVYVYVYDATWYGNTYKQDCPPTIVKKS